MLLKFFVAGHSQGSGREGKGESELAKGAVHWPRHAMRVFCLPHDQVQQQHQQQQQLADSAVFFTSFFFALRLALVSASTSTLAMALALF